ncbi:MAG TPA: hypothetical protein VH591_19520 [Ktedonobacterales bacterium]|jgi:hypothetical protein
MADTWFEASETEPAAADEFASERQPETEHIDVEALAEKVYRLMMDEIRLDRARGLTTSDGR